jgi:hypothetical protein
MLTELGGVDGGIGKAIRSESVRRLLTEGDYLEQLRARRQHCEETVGAKWRHVDIDINCVFCLAWEIIGRLT